MSRTTTSAQKTLATMKTTKTRLLENQTEENALAEPLQKTVRENKSLLVKPTNKKLKLRTPLKEMLKSQREEEIAEEEVELKAKEVNPERTLKANRKTTTPTTEDKPVVTKTKKVELDTRVNVPVVDNVVVVNADPEVETTITTMMDLVKTTTTKDPPAETTREMKERATRVMLTTKEVNADQDNLENPENLEKEIKLKETEVAVEIVEIVEIVNQENPESLESQENPENREKVKAIVEVKKDAVEDAVDVVVVEAVAEEEEAPVRVAHPAPRIEVTTEHLYSALDETISFWKALATLRNPCTINNNISGVLCAPRTLCETPV